MIHSKCAIYGISNYLAGDILDYVTLVVICLHWLILTIKKEKRVSHLDAFMVVLLSAMYLCDKSSETGTFECVGSVQYQDASVKLKRSASIKWCKYSLELCPISETQYSIANDRIELITQSTH